MQSNQTEAEQTVTSAVRSMTGYGRAQQLIGNKEITVEIRSVNHRFLEYSSRVPRAYSYLEDRLKNLVKASVSRGKVDVSLSIQTVSGTDSQVVINHDLARSYLEALKSLAEDLQIKNDITVSQMTRFSDIFTVLRVADDEEEMWSAVEQVAQEAINNFVAMRLVEDGAGSFVPTGFDRTDGQKGRGTFSKNSGKLFQTPACKTAGGFAEQRAG
jgi:uncharacterized protein (TIGR00255 family)